MTIHKFVKMSIQEKTLCLIYEGVFIDEYKDKEDSIFIYYLHEFFVEIKKKKRLRTTLEMIPFKRGFSLKNESSSILKQKPPFNYIKKRYNINSE